MPGLSQLLEDYVAAETLQTEVAKSFRSETQKRYVFLKYCVALSEGHLEGRSFWVPPKGSYLESWAGYRHILIGIKHSCWIDDPRRPFNMTFITSTPFFMPKDGRGRE